MSENYYNCLIETDYYEIVLMRNINSCPTFYLNILNIMITKLTIFLSKLTQINNKHLLTF